MPPAKRRGRFLSIRVTDAQWEALQAEAERRGIGLSELIRERILKSP